MKSEIEGIPVSRELDFNNWHILVYTNRAVYKISHPVVHKGFLSFYLPDTGATIIKIKLFDAGEMYKQDYSCRTLITPTYIIFALEDLI